MNIAAQVRLQEPPNQYADEYAQRLKVELADTECGEMSYDTLRRRVTLSMWLRYGLGAQAPDPEVTPAWVQGVQGVDVLVAAQLTPEA